MSRVRIVNGTVEDLLRRTDAELDALVPKAMTREEAARVAAAAIAEKVTPCGTLSDPKGMLADAIGRFEEVPNRPSTIARAKDLCNKHAIEDGRFRVEWAPDMDVIIVLHPVPGKVTGVVEGTTVEVDRYMVFGRERGGNGEEISTPWDCYTCNNAARQHHRKGGEVGPVRVKPHKCWKLRPPKPNMVPMLFAWAHGIDDAEDLAKELASAWSATAEQQLDDNAKIDWSRIVDSNLDSENRREYSFSGDYIAGMLAANPNAWSSLSADDQMKHVQ